jgi:imidazolonepropionase-like amidohydrolase
LVDADAGGTRMQMIVAASRNAATACEFSDELGTVEAGKIADVNVVRGNPQEDVIVVQYVTVVIHAGAVIRDAR